MTFREVMEEYFKSWRLSVRESTSISHKILMKKNPGGNFGNDFF